METLLRIGLSNAVAALLLALLVVTVACVWRRPAVLHALWILVLVKLVTPPLVWLPEPWAVSTDAAPASGGRQPPDFAPHQGADAPRSPGPAPVVLDAAPADPPAAEFVIVQDTPAEAAPAEAPAAPPPTAVLVAPPPASPWWLPTAFGLWLIGTVAWYALALIRLRRFRRLLRHAVPAPESLRQRTQRLAEKLRLRRRPPVWLMPGRVAPMLWAAGGSPCILFPSDLLGQTTTEQQNALLVHELAHLRRRDHWVRWLEFAASGLYWWNPVLWFARRELREAEEQCCDAWVTSTLPGAGKTYAVALLETLDFLSDAPRATPLLASGVGRVADLKRRLTMIMRGTTPRALSWRGLLAVLGLGALLLPLLPAWARAQAPAKPDAPDKPEVRTLRFIDADATGREDLQMAKAELQELEAKLAQKQAEAAEIAAKVEALRAKLAAADGQPKRIVVSVDGQNAKYAAVLKWIQTAQPGWIQMAQPGGENAKVFVVDGKVIVVDGATGKILMTTNGPIPAPPPPPAAVSADKQYFLRWTVAPKDGPIFAVPPGAVAPTPPADADKRIDELETKLKRILDEVEQLRKERKPDAFKSGQESEEQRFRVFIKPAPQGAKEEPAKALVTERDALQKKVLQLMWAKADAEKAQGEAAVEQARAALDAAQARLEQAEAEAKRTAQLVLKGAAPPADLKQIKDEAEARRADLEVARANLIKMTEDDKVRQAEIETRLNAAEAERQAAEAKIQQLEEELRKLKEAPNGDAPKRP